MNDTYTLLQNLVTATEARDAATEACRWAEKRSRVAEIENRDALEIASTLGTQYPDAVDAAYKAVANAYTVSSEACQMQAAAYAAAKAYVEGRALAAFAAAFTPTEERFGDEA